MRTKRVVAVLAVSIWIATAVLATPSWAATTTGSNLCHASTATCSLNAIGRQSGFGGFEFLYASASDPYTQVAVKDLAAAWDAAVWAAFPTLPFLVYVDCATVPQLCSDNDATPSALEVAGVDVVWNTPDAFSCGGQSAVYGCTTMNSVAPVGPCCSDINWTLMQYGNSEVTSFGGQLGGTGAAQWTNLFTTVCLEVGLSMGMNEWSGDSGGCMNTVESNGGPWYSTTDVANLLTDYGAD